MARSAQLLAQPGTLLARSRAWWSMRGADLPLLLSLIAVALVAHGFNMFYSPAMNRLDDEGIYMAQAWAVLREGRLAPYTYWYDHAPGGWILIAGWLALTGGPLSFGSAIDSGRILMLALHLVMVLLLYRIARKLGASRPAAAVATLVFSLSPLAIYYQRFVLLDTIMLFWLLLSVELLLDGWGRLSRFVLSGVCFGIAILSKETAVFLVPAMLLLAWQQRWKHHGRFAIVGWLLPMAVVVSLYPLYAILKGELLPAGQSFGFFMFGSRLDPHVSLSESLRWQASRSGGGMLNLDNQFWQLVRTEWLVRDAFLFAGGALATAANALRGARDRRLLIAGLLGLLPLFYLARGGVVFDFYVLFAIPFLCLNLGLLLDLAVRHLPARSNRTTVAIATAALLGGYLLSGALQPLYLDRSALPGREATAWIKRHLPADSRIVVRDGFWVDLHEEGLGGPAFPDAHSHWKVAADPAIKGGVFHEDWRRVDYLLMSPGLEDDFEATGNTVALEALRRSHPVKRWETGGAVVELRKVGQPGSTEAMLLSEGSASIVRRFERGGAFADSAGRVTSEAQSYAMLRAAWTGDRAAFDRAWRWTEANLVDERGLPAWLWEGGAVRDEHSAADASTDTALALLLGGRRWEDQELITAGTRMVEAIWEHEVAIFDGRPYITAGDWASGSDVVAINPSYFAPYAYRVFQAADPGHDWKQVIDTGYEVLFEAAKATYGDARSAGLPPDWIGLDRASGAPVRLELPSRDTTQYGFDAARTYWRVALDYRWSGDGRAESFLKQAGFLRDEVERKGGVSSVYGHDGTIVEEAPSTVGTAGALAALLTLDPERAHGLYAAHILGAVRREGQALSWDNPDDLYAQEWGWFATALYADALPDLWHARAGDGPAE